MTVTLTSPAYGKQPGQTFSGTAKEEAWLVASGYAKKNAGPYTGPGLDNTGPADVSVANNLEFNPVAHQIAGDGGTPEKGTNDGDLKLHDPDAPFKSLQGDAFGPEEDSPFTGFANDPDVFPLDTALVTLTPATGVAAGGTTVNISGSGFNDVTGVTFGGTAGVNFVRNSRTSITVKTPPHAAGAVAVVLQRAAGDGGDKSKANGFTFTA